MTEAKRVNKEMKNKANTPQIGKLSAYFHKEQIIESRRGSLNPTIFS